MDYSISMKVLKNFYMSFMEIMQTIDEVYKAIKYVYDNEEYLMDTHTAVGSCSIRISIKRKLQDYRQALVASTASPYKFPRSICNALGIDISGKLNDFEILNILSNNTNTNIPNNLKNLR